MTLPAQTEKCKTEKGLRPTHRELTRITRELAEHRGLTTGDIEVIAIHFVRPMIIMDFDGQILHSYSVPRKTTKERARGKFNNHFYP